MLHPVQVRKPLDHGQDYSDEAYQGICDQLIMGGYFRARLPIDPFDKILGGMCWTIVGSNYNVDLDFEDDLNLGAKIKLAEKVILAIEAMECPFALAAYQIQGLDYGRIGQVIKWLITKLMSSRDTRSLTNRKQGLLNFRLRQPDASGQEDGVFCKQDKVLSVDPSFLKQIIFNGKPKRIYKANRDTNIDFKDPKRIHIALREFDDLSAKDVFSSMIDTIKSNEVQANKLGGAAMGRQSFALDSKANAVGAEMQRSATRKMGGPAAAGGLARSMTVAPETPNSDSIDGGAHRPLNLNAGIMDLGGLDLEEADQADVINEVEKMLQFDEKKTKAMNKDKKAAKTELDMNSGAVTSVAPMAVITTAGGTISKTTSHTHSVQIERKKKKKEPKTEE